MRNNDYYDGPTSKWHSLIIYAIIIAVAAYVMVYEFKSGQIEYALTFAAGVVAGGYFFIQTLRQKK